MGERAESSGPQGVGPNSSFPFTPCASLPSLGHVCPTHVPRLRMLSTSCSLCSYCPTVLPSKGYATLPVSRKFLVLLSLDLPCTGLAPCPLECPEGQGPTVLHRFSVHLLTPGTQ